MTDILEVDQLGVRYGSITAVHEISFGVGDGELVSLVGPNGAGKSSVLAAIVGTVRSSGSITFEGRSISGLPIESIVRTGIALVPEGRNIFGSLSVRENLLLGATVRKDRAAVTADIDEQLERFSALKDRMKQPAGLLSGGQQQQLAIARALMSRPKLLLLDEPSLGLAPQLVDLVLAAVADLRDSGLTIVLVEQNAMRAVELADRTHVLGTGRILRSGTAEELNYGKDIAGDYLGGVAL